MHERLKAIRERPGLFLGNTDTPFTSLLGFIDGYECGFLAGEHSAVTKTAQIEWLVDNEGLHRFVAERYGELFPTTKGWRGFIREHARDEQDAFRQFFELLSEYEKRRSNDTKAQIRDLLRAKPFVPFVIHMTNSRKHRITDPSFVMASPNERSMVIVEEEHDDRMHYLPTALIRSVEPAA